MSMLSAQIDELRKWADQLSERENEFGVVVRALVAALRDAADTIWQLRDDLQRTNVAVQDAEHDESMAWDRVRKAEAENAKLQEQAARLFDKTLELGTENDKLREFATVAWELLTCNEPVFVWSGLQEKARELGIEVSG